MRPTTSTTKPQTTSMKTDIETLTLRDGALSLTLLPYSLAEFDKLSDDARWALVQAGVDGWKYRGATRHSKEEGFVNDGKTLSLADIAEELMREGRSSGPSKADKERGQDLADRAFKAFPTGKPETTGDPKTDQAAIEAAREAAGALRRQFVEEKFAAAQEAKPWIKWEWNTDKSILDNCIAVQHAARQPKPEPKKKVAKYL